MPGVPFLTDLDSRAAVKGSRDPLGVQAIWTRLGRYLIGNLTTVTASVRDFAVLVLGYHFAERVAIDRAGDGDLAVFLKWEQLAAYARGEINGDWSFRGVERVQKNLQDRGRVRLGADPTAQILGNQKIYGLWGLYTAPARSSGLVEGYPARLTENARRTLVEDVYLPIFTRASLRDGEEIVRLLAKPRVDIDVHGRDRPLLTAVAKVLPKKVFAAERVPFREHLLVGGPQDRTTGSQAFLGDLLASIALDTDWRLSSKRVSQLEKAARRVGPRGDFVAERLKQIRICESVIATAAALFDFLLGSHDQTISDVSKAVEGHWGRTLSTIDAQAISVLEPDLCKSTGDEEAGRRWILIGRNLAEGSYSDAISKLLEQNRFVMNKRAGAAPWIDVRRGKLYVQFRDEEPLPLPGRKDLDDYWRHPYFLDSLRSIALSLRE